MGFAWEIYAFSSWRASGRFNNANLDTATDELCVMAKPGFKIVCASLGQEHGEMTVCQIHAAGLSSRITSSLTGRKQKNTTHINEIIYR